MHTSALITTWEADVVRFINCFEVPQGRDEEFLSLFREVNAHMAAQPGYQGHRLHRAVLPGARYRFVNYVEWASADHWRSAHGPEFRRLVQRPEWGPFPSTPALYDVVDERSAAGGA
jgi:heme-degrading monooxygenase HmoA